MLNENTDAKKKVAIDESCNAADVELSHGDKDELIWCSQGSGFTVKFKGKSPFTEHKFIVPPGECCGSGPIVVDAPTGSIKNRYEYDIFKKGGSAVDPAVIIKK